VTEERLKRAPKLALSLTAGVGSDHVDLIAASKVSDPLYCRRLHATACLPQLLDANQAPYLMWLYVAVRQAGLTVAEVTGSNTVSVAEHALMMILVRSSCPPSDYRLHLSKCGMALWQRPPRLQPSMSIENRSGGRVSSLARSTSQELSLAHHSTSTLHPFLNSPLSVANGVGVSPAADPGAQLHGGAPAGEGRGVGHLQDRRQVRIRCQAPA